jgi:dihydroorotate dehydrogenase
LPGDIATRLVRLLPPEPAHLATIAALKAGLGPKGTPPPQSLRLTLAGLNLPGPVGLAAGFDKNAEVPDAMLRAGFDFVECGTVTPQSQAGNPKPRLFRLSEDEAVINRMGFNNEGLAPFVERLRARAERRGVVGANVGANKDQPDRPADYVAGMEAAWPYASYITANISSPNTAGLRGLQERGALEELLGRMREARAPLEAKHGAKPVFLKIAPDLAVEAAIQAGETALSFGIDALIISNTTIERPKTLTSKYATETGGLSGRPLFQPSTELLREVYLAFKSRLPLIGAGGIASGADAWAKLKAGASAIQLYSALVFQGPGLVSKIHANLATRLKSEGAKSLSEVIGTA